MMKNKYLIIVVVIFTFIASCDKNDYEQETNDPITFVNIGKGALYGNGTEGVSSSNLVITNNADWQNLITQMNSVNNVLDNFSEISIDFNEYMLIATILDVKENGWEIEITEIIETASEIIVSKQETESVTLVITQPFHIVKIPINNKIVTFL